MEQLAWNLLLFSIALFVAKIVFGIVDERDESKREKERAAREAERRQQERQRDIEKTIDTVRSGKWIYGRISTDDWSEDQKARLARAVEICERREQWRAGRAQ